MIGAVPPLPRMSSWCDRDTFTFASELLLRSDSLTVTYVRQFVGVRWGSANSLRVL